MNDNKELSYIDKKLLVLDQSIKEVDLELDKKAGPLLRKKQLLEEEKVYLKKMKSDINKNAEPNPVNVLRKPVKA